MLGTREPECQKAPQSRIKTTRILVPIFREPERNQNLFREPESRAAVEWDSPGRSRSRPWVLSYTKRWNPPIIIILVPSILRNQETRIGKVAQGRMNTAPILVPAFLAKIAGKKEALAPEARKHWAYSGSRVLGTTIEPDSARENSGNQFSADSTHGGGCEATLPLPGASSFTAGTRRRGPRPLLKPARVRPTFPVVQPLPRRVRFNGHCETASAMAHPNAVGRVFVVCHLRPKRTVRLAQIKASNPATCQVSASAVRPAVGIGYWPRQDANPAKSYS